MIKKCILYGLRRLLDKHKTMNKYYYDLPYKELLEYYDTLTLENATHDHIQEVEKEIENR